ncbi:uncharacterized protein LOC144442320 [Glandiceps talaboti]
MIGLKRRSSEDQEDKRGLLKKQKSISSALREFDISEGGDDDIVDTQEPETEPQIVPSFEEQDESILTTLKHGVEHLGEIVLPCISPMNQTDEPVSAESFIKLPHPNGFLQSIGIKFCSCVEGDGSRSVHKITEVHDQLFQGKLRPGDVLHTINGLNVSKRRHTDLLELMYHLDEEFELVIKRKSENTEPPDEDVDEEDWAGEIVTHIKIKIKLNIDGDKIVFEVESCVEKELSETPLIGFYKEVDMYIYKPTDTGVVLAMTDQKTVGLMANKKDDLKGQWTVYHYKVFWPGQSRNQVNQKDTRYSAVVLHNKEFNQCLAVSTWKNQTLTFEKPTGLNRLNSVDGRLFYKREWSTGSDRVAFESALCQGFYLFRKGDGIILEKQENPDSLHFNTGFAIFTESEIESSRKSIKQ